MTTQSRKWPIAKWIESVFCRRRPMLHDGCGGEVYLAALDGPVPCSWYCPKCKKLWGFLDAPTDISYRDGRKMTLDAAGTTAFGQGHADGGLRGYV